jgi:hypothetical protein
MSASETNHPILKAAAPLFLHHNVIIANLESSQCDRDTFQIYYHRRRPELNQKIQLQIVSWRFVLILFSVAGILLER